MYIVDKYFSEASEKVYSVVIDETEAQLYQYLFSEKDDDDDEKDLFDTEGNHPVNDNIRHRLDEVNSHRGLGTAAGIGVATDLITGGWGRGTISSLGGRSIGKYAAKLADRHGANEDLSRLAAIGGGALGGAGLAYATKSRGLLGLAGGGKIGPMTKLRMAGSALGGAVGAYKATNKSLKKQRKKDRELVVKMATKK